LLGVGSVEHSQPPAGAVLECIAVAGQDEELVVSLILQP